MLVDVHAHLTYGKFEEDLKDVVERSNCKIIISNGTDIEDNRKVIELSKNYPNVKVALGLYPGNLIKMDEKVIERELRFIENTKPLALGEVGLDGTYENMEKQIKWFKEFIRVSLFLDIPLIVHTRKAEKEVIDVLEEMRAKKVVLHCFNGNHKLVQRAEKLGYYFSIPLIVTYLEHFKEIVKKVSITKLLTETDSPYLSNIKGQRNEPGNVALIVKEIAKIKGMDEKEVENSIFMNYQRLF